MLNRTLWCGAAIALLAISSAAQNTFPASGNVGIGTTAPSQLLTLGIENGTDLSLHQTIRINSGGFAEPGAFDTLSNGDKFILYDSVGANYDARIGIGNASDMWFKSSGPTPGSGIFRWFTGPTPTQVMTILGNGNVGIGATSPGATLEVNGNVKLTSGSGASITYADGTIQSTAWNGVLSGGDYAESVDVQGDRNSYEPGDVLVINSEVEGGFVLSSHAYSTAVMGIYSTKPGARGRRQKTDLSYMKDEVPMAMIGIVPTKVSAENGPIHSGDLLVTSSRPGYAMKGTDRSQMLGAVIGKALGHLDSGTGVIEVGVTLQ